VRTTYHLLGMGRFAQLVTVTVVACLLATGCGSTQTTSTEAATAVVRPAASTSSTPATPSPTRRHRRRKASARAAAKLPLAGKVVGIDPGHNGRNYTDPSYINHLIWNGREEEGCDTTGTQTDSGYTEAQFNWNVASYLAADLRTEGAKVVLTRHSNDGIGPCVNTRAQIINRAHANVAIDIHADGGPDYGRGVAVLEPVADGPNNRVIKASKRFGAILLARYRALTKMPDSTYDGVHGITLRDDLAGLNLTTVPKVLIECGNMRNATDAAMLVRSSFQRLTARAFAQAITEFLTRAHQ
jgi:N-acetylmuramoyl-L-alanine amidase